MTNDPNAAKDAATAEDDFLASIRIDQSYANDSIGVKKVLTTVPIRKPNKQEFVRVHPDHSYDCFMVELKTEREFYFVAKDVAQALSEFVEPARLRLAVTRQGVAILWPIKLPKDDGRGDTWRKSAAEAADLARRSWVRIAADLSLSAYQPFIATGNLGEPVWPEEDFDQILRLALRDHVIRSVDHPVVRQLLGQV